MNINMAINIHYISRHNANIDFRSDINQFRVRMKSKLIQLIFLRCVLVLLWSVYSAFLHVVVLYLTILN